VATAICEHMGCWMAVAPEGDTKGTTVRLKVEDGVIVFPVSAKGKKVSAEGVFEEVKASDAEGKEAAGEHAKHDAKASKTYQLKATGAIIH
jgi:predicted transcriptional regulator